MEGHVDDRADERRRQGQPEPPARRDDKNAEKEHGAESVAGDQPFQRDTPAPSRARSGRRRARCPPTAAATWGAGTTTPRGGRDSRGFSLVIRRYQAVLDLLGGRHVHVEDPGVQHRPVAQRGPHGAVQPVLEIDHASPPHGVREQVAVERRVLREQAVQLPARWWSSPARRGGSAAAGSAPTADTTARDRGTACHRRTPLKITPRPFDLCRVAMASPCTEVSRNQRIRHANRLAEVARRHTSC